MIFLPRAGADPRTGGVLVCHLALCLPARKGRVCTCTHVRVHVHTCLDVNACAHSTPGESAAGSRWRAARRHRHWHSWCACTPCVCVCVCVLVCVCVCTRAYAHACMRECQSVFTVCFLARARSRSLALACALSRALSRSLALSTAERAQEFCEVTGFPPDQLLADPGNAIYDALQASPLITALYSDFA